ncbi:tyrosine-type recombinase/integrase [Novilysobacter arseniciresistens]|uniref:tyrosine-type recombinase/integrase n=1 Tax=Novilysobacter arseniciresistens TaxID=1385522 RepID=UPI003CCD9AE7
MAIKVRNYCLFHVTIAVLARRSEAVLLELMDLDLGASPSVLIKMPTLAMSRRRRDGAALKTKGRQVPISANLAELLRCYVYEFRPLLLKNGRPSTSLFLSDRDGRRLSSGAFNQILRKAANLPEIQRLGKRLHPHALRHAGATAARRTITSNGATHDELAECLTYLGGWSPGSPMVQHYTRAAISERVAKLIRANGS